MSNDFVTGADAQDGTPTLGEEVERQLGDQPASQPKPKKRIRPAERKGSIFWVPLHLARRLGALVWRHKVRSAIVLAILIPLLMVVRAYVQPSVVQLRIWTLEILLCLIAAGFVYKWRREKKYLKVIILTLVVVGLFTGIRYASVNPHLYQTLFYQYSTLDKQLLDELPETRFERIHPLHSIHTATNKRIGDTLHTTIPDYISWGEGEDPHWTVGIEPAYPHQRLFGQVERIFSLPGQNHLLDFSGENQVAVMFDSGEAMHFTKRRVVLGASKVWPGAISVLRTKQYEIHSRA